MPISQAEVFDQLAATRAQLLALLGRLDNAGMERIVYGTWSAKNVVAHLAAWEAWVLHALPIRLATGTTPADMRARIADEDGYNAQEVAARAHLSPSEQVAELEQIRAKLITYVRGLDSVLLEQTNPWDTWQGTVPEYLLAALGDHEQEHIEGLREVL